MNILKTSCLRIPAQFETEPWCRAILKDLTRMSSDFGDPTVKIQTRYFMRRDGYILIPRFYDIYKHGHSVLDYTPDGADIDFEFKREWRNDLQRSGFQFLTQNDHGILKLPPGEGKTVISIGAICAIKKKTIIFVHKDSLVNQWCDEIIRHSTITKNDIGRLSTANCRELFDKPIVLSTVQTMNSMIDRLPDIENLLRSANFGLALWDECHTTTGAPQYSKTSMMMPCRKVFGLSATPGRADQNHDIIWKHLGSVHAPQGKTNTLAPKICMLHFSHGAIYAKQYIYWGPRDANGDTKLKYARFDRTRYFSILMSKKNVKYISMMQKIAFKTYKLNRISLLISDRIKILDLIARVIPKHDAGFFIPRSKDKRDSELLKKFVFSTPGSSRDGTNREELDCLIMANTISNIEQAIGRICRYLPNKPQPIVFDCVDTDFEETMDQAEKRKIVYQEKNWEVEDIFLK